MKTLGLLGLGSFSTLYYIQKLNTFYNTKYGGFSTCPFKMLNVDFNTINNLLPNTSTELDIIVKSCIKTLEELQIDAILIPNITLHETIDRLNISTKIIHPITKTITKLLKNKHAKVTLFGTRHTMQSDYIKSKFEAENIMVLQPNVKEMSQIDNLRISVYNNQQTQEQLMIFNNLLKKYTTNGVVVLACTELSVIHNSKNKLVYDMAQIQLEEAVDFI
ncbi:MAG: aspartate racemase [Olleya marilimosa]|jgi:aspartate racemase